MENRSCHRAEAERLIRRLHVLMIAGQGDTDEAEAVRDGLGDCHRNGNLSPEESLEIDHISLALWKAYDAAKGIPTGPRSPAEALWLNPITPAELAEWEAAIDASRHDEAPITHSNMLRLIAEVRALRNHLSPAPEPVTSPVTSPVTPLP